MLDLVERTRQQHLEAEVGGHEEAVERIADVEEGDLSGPGDAAVPAHVPRLVLAVARQRAFTRIGHMMRSALKEAHARRREGR